jgi:hypothetical protein
LKKLDYLCHKAQPRLKKAALFDMKNKKTIFYLIPVILFLFLSAPDYVRRSMYNDGIWYAILSKNLAEGEGTFWNPKLTETIYPEFHEHPPLVFGIQSVFFEIFGDGIAVERLYAFFIFLASAMLIVLIWRDVFKTNRDIRELWFLPLSLWLLNEVTWHFYPANVLEPTMGVFTLSAVWLMLRASALSMGRREILLAAAAGIAVMAATLSKGFVGLFPLAFFGIHWLVFRKFSFGSMLGRTLIVTAALALGYAVLLSNQEARESLAQYFNTQVMASVSGERTEFHFRENRLYIIGRLGQVLLPASALSLLFIIPSFRQKPAHFSLPLFRYSLFFILIGISASFPLAISPKQSFYYLVPSIPYFAIGLSILASPMIALLIGRIDERAQGFRLMKFFSLALLAGAIVFASSQIGGINRRDRAVLNDIRKIGAVVPEDAVIASKAHEKLLAYQAGYLYRLFEISVDTGTIDRTHLITWKDDTLPAGAEGFREIELGLELYDLYVRK